MEVSVDSSNTLFLYVLCQKRNMNAVFVVHLPVTGDTITELSLQGDPGVWYLPDDSEGDEVELSPEPDEQHSMICLGIFSLLSDQGTDVD